MIYKFLPEALIELAPNRAFVINGDFELKNVTWNENVPKSDIPKDKNIIKKCDELQAAEPMRILRLERNLLLQQTDWRMTTDYPYEDQAAWASYRTQLRDLPESAEPTLDETGKLIVDWPTPPDQS